MEGSRGRVECLAARKREATLNRSHTDELVSERGARRRRGIRQWHGRELGQQKYTGVSCCGKIVPR